MREQDHVSKITFPELAFFIFFEFSIRRITGVADDDLFQRQSLVGVIGIPFFAVHANVQIDHRVIRSHRPITAKGNIIACVFDVSPCKGQRPALLANTCRPHVTFGNAKRSMAGLHGWKNIQLLEARQVIGMINLDVLHTVTAVALPICLLNCLVTIERSPHCAISAAMDEYLQAHLVAQLCHAGEMLKGVNAIGVGFRDIGVRLHIECRVGFPNTVHEEFGCAAACKVALHLRHFSSFFFDHLFGCLRFDVIWNIHAQG